MMNLKKEYNEFGPWLSEIRNEEDITHQFIHLKNAILSADFAVKVPVDKVWRDVKEGDLLYDTVLSLDKEGFAYHRIIEGVAYSCKVPFSDIDSIQLDEGYLSDELIIGTALENIHISYMPIPAEVANKAIHMLTEGFIGSNDPEAIVTLPTKNGLIYHKEGVTINDPGINEPLSMSS